MDDLVLKTALKYLNRQGLTTQKLTEKLLKTGFDIDVVTECVARVCELGYVNNREWGADRLRSLQNKLKSRNYIEVDLAHSGLEQAVIDELMEAHYPKVIEVDIARKLVARKFNAQQDSPVKMGQYLFRNGFSEATVRLCFPEVSTT